MSVLSVVLGFLVGLVSEFAKRHKLRRRTPFAIDDTVHGVIGFVDELRQGSTLQDVPYVRHAGPLQLVGDFRRDLLSCRLDKRTEFFFGHPM